MVPNGVLRSNSQNSRGLDAKEEGDAARAQRELQAAGVAKSDAKKKPETLREEAGDLSDLWRDPRHWFVECG